MTEKKTMDTKSLLKMYKGSRCLGPSQPILILAADNTQRTNKDILFTEYYLFHRFKSIPFLYGRDSFEAPYGADNKRIEFSLFPQLFTFDPLFTRQVETAIAELQDAVWKYDRELHRELFFSERLLEFREEINDAYLMRFRVFRQFVEEQRIMFRFTKSAELKHLEKKLTQIPEFECKHEP